MIGAAAARYRRFTLRPACGDALAEFAFDLVAVGEGRREPDGDLGHGHITWRSDPTCARAGCMRVMTTRRDARHVMVAHSPTPFHGEEVRG